MLQEIYTKQIEKDIEKLLKEFKNRIITVIMIFSVIPSMMALLNNYFTVNLLFSAILITYGVLFAVFALKFSK